MIVLKATQCFLILSFLQECMAGWENRMRIRKKYRIGARIWVAACRLS